MKKTLLSLLVLWWMPGFAFCAADGSKAGPNLLFIIADDASRHFGQVNGCSWVKTPNIDKLAQTGLVFDQVYTPTSKCAPSRAAILTGRNPWQLEEAANHQPYFPAKFIAFSEALARNGITCGSSGKVWGPGEAKTSDGKPRDFALRSGGSFKDFLSQREPGRPFFYWFGSHYPHRPYKMDSGIAAGKKPEAIERVPGYWPDNETVRKDMLDYAIEVEAFDQQVGELLAALEESGQAANTLVIVTSDHGMPFPRVKGHTFDDAHHVPFVVRWPEGIPEPGRKVTDLLSFIDLAPTFLELFGIDGLAAGMAPVTGHSFVDLLRGSAKIARPHVLLGRERNDVLCRPGSPAGLGYPVRALRQSQWFYAHNFESERWPCGDPDLGLKDTDDGPTKQFIQALGDADQYWQAVFGKHPADQLFDVEVDPDCLVNRAAELPELVTTLRNTLFAELKKQNDPRIFGQGALFDNYPSPRTLAQPPKKKK